MNAKELRAAAEASYNWYVTPNVEDAHRNMPDHVFYTGWQACKHILATVHTDDAEPVTVEFADTIGTESPNQRCGRAWDIWQGNSGGMVMLVRLLLDCLSLDDDEEAVWMAEVVTHDPDNEPQWHTGFGVYITTRGQLRHLLAGLGMGGAKCR